MKKVLSMILAILMIVTAASVFASCGDETTAAPESKTPATEAPTTEAPTAPADTDSAYVKGKGKLVVGITDFAPMDYQNATGEWIGFDADLAKAFAEYLGVTVEFSEIVWENKVLELNGKQIDCVWNGMTLTDEVKETMETTVPYCNNAQIVIVAADKAADYQTVEACKTLKFAVENGSAGQEMAEANGFEFTPVETQAMALAEVAAGTCDAAIIDSLMAAAMVGAGTGYESLASTIQLNSELYGVGFRKGSDLAEIWNTFYAAAKTSGALLELAEVYGVQTSLIND